jgi:hypothetical protein
MYPVKTNLWERRQIPPDPPPIVATCLVGPVNYKWGQLTSNCFGPVLVFFLNPGRHNSDAIVNLEPQHLNNGIEYIFKYNI